MIIPTVMSEERLLSDDEAKEIVKVVRTIIELFDMNHVI